tara:strand:- start:204 stop:968 length:765 start_codon:yes stop_codon:yes gene_type:complete
MAFWTGLEAITGHPAGAFKGMSMSDWFDNEKWQRMPRTWSGKMNPQGATESARQLDMRTNRAGEPMYTKWFNQRGWEQLPQQGDTREALHAGAAKDRPSYEDQFAAIMRNRHGPSVPAVTQPANLQYPGIGPNAGISLMPNWQGSSLTEDRDVGMGANRLFQLGDPRNIRSGPDLPPASKKTVKKIFADPNKSNEIIETIEEKVPTGSAQWGNSQHPPNWQDRINPTSLMNILNPNAWRDVAKRKWLERQARRY